MLELQGTDAFLLIRRRPRALAHVGFRLADPAPQRFRCAAEFAAMDWIAADCEACSPWRSKTIRTARSRTSGEYRFHVFMTPSSQSLESPGIPGRFTVESPGTLSAMHSIRKGLRARAAFNAAHYVRHRLDQSSG
jgi:hypothetical protein